MSTFQIVLLVITVILIAAVIALYFYGRRMEKKRAEQEEQIAAAAQQVDMLIIDKKRMKMKDAGLPQIVMEQTPKYLRRSKLPIVKAKVGPQFITLIAAEEIFDEIPVKKPVKATVSGIYITAVKGLRKPLEKPVEVKKGFRAKMAAKLNDLRKKANGK